MKRKTKSQSIEPSDDEFAVAVLCSFRRVILVYLELARQGDSTLIHELPIYARQIVEALDEIALKYPDLLAEQAQHQVAWPIMAARHYPKESDFKRLAERIKLGSKTVVNLSPRARYKLKTPINRFLLKLLEGNIATPKDFYFVPLPDNPPKLAPKTVSYYLDDLIMPMLDGHTQSFPTISDIFGDSKSKMSASKRAEFPWAILQFCLVTPARFVQDLASPNRFGSGRGHVSPWLLCLFQVPAITDT